MLKDLLYIIQNISLENNVVEALIKLNATHEIFKGHFPAQPVLPGACVLQMLKEVLEISLNKSLHLFKADEIKFLQMIEPNNEVLHFSINYKFIENASVNIAAKIFKTEVLCCRMKALFHIQE